jgi:hypothetical protein
MPSNDLNLDNEVSAVDLENDDIGSDIAASIEKLKAVDPVDVDADDAVAIEPAKPEESSEDIIEEKYEAPTGYSAKVKEQWDTLPKDVQAELVKRETDFHKMVTSRDGELNLGREYKEIISPYTQILQQRGSSPAKVISSALQTMYALETGTEESKLAILQQIAKQHNVTLTNEPDAEYVDPVISQLQQELSNLKKLADPEVLFKQLQETQERSNVQKEADAFASNPENKYFDKVKPFMAAFLGEGVAKDFKEAYDMACNAHPEVRSILDAERKTADIEKRKAELKAKQNAASSISGSPATAVSNTANPTDDIESAVRNAFRSAGGKI